MVEVIAETMGADIELQSLPYDLAGAGDSLLTDSMGFHRVMDLQKLRVDLDYHDAVPVADAVRATVEWLATHPAPPGGTLEEHIGDAFDYEVEDRLVDAYRAAMDGLVSLAPVRPEGFTPHSYAHPVTPGQAADHRGR